MVLSNSQMKLFKLINQTGRQLSPSRWIFFSEVYVSHTSFALIVKVLHFFLSLLQITNDVFLTHLQMWLPESDVRRIIRKMLSFHGKTEKNCCLVDTAFSTGCDEKSFVSIFGESAAELPPQPLPGAAPPFIEAASSARKDGSPPHALHTTIQEPCADDTR